MLNYKLKTSFLALFFLVGSLSAQKVLTLEDAVRQALDHNHGIKVAQNSVAIAQNNATVGNAGLLPKVDLSAGVNYQNSNTKIEFTNPDQPAIEQNGAAGNSQNASIALTYTLFDGLGTIYNFQKLKSLNENARIQSRLTIENTMTQIVNAYYTIGRYQEQVNIAREAITVTNDRLARAEEKLKFGVATRLDVLNAKVDLNTDSVTYSTALINFENAKRSLSQLAGGGENTDYITDDQIAYSSQEEVAEMVRLATENNIAVQLAKHNRSLVEYDLKSAKSQMFPRLDLSASYGYNRSQSDASFIRENTSLGFNGGISLNWNLFNGRQNAIQRQNAQINMNTQTEQYEDAVETLKKDLDNALAVYYNNLAMLKNDEKNLSLYELNFSQTEERYNLGQATNTQLREAQLNLLSAKSRINDQKITAKLAETEIVRLSGWFMKQLD